MERACLPYVSIIIIMYIYVLAFVERRCAVSGERESPTSESSQIVREQPGFGDHSDSPGEARHRIVAERSRTGPASDSCRIVRE